MILTLEPDDFSNGRNLSPMAFPYVSLSTTSGAPVYSAPIAFCAFLKIFFCNFSQNLCHENLDVDVNRAAKKIWITWEVQRRNRTLSKRLGAELYEIVVGRQRIERYFISLVKTLNILIKTKPDIVFVQNPSLVLALFTLFLRKIFIFKLIVDEHNSGIYPLEGSSRFLNYFAKYIAIKSDYVIVTNIYLSRIITDFGGRPLILPDPIPELNLEKKESFENKECFHVAFVCTWANDEPFIEVIEAARMLGEGFKISITGKCKGKVDHNSIPKNVELTGYLSEDDYVKLLNKIDVVMVLTNRENCLNCGAYEAVSVEKPLILSNKQALKEYFRRGVVFTENGRNDISVNIKKLKFDIENKKFEIFELKKMLLQEWDKLKDEVVSVIDN